MSSYASDTTTQEQSPSQADRINATFYTDPLCCWSWAIDQHWKKIKQQYSETLTVRYVMGGMIPDWRNYNDPLNSVSRPLQLGPVWMHASQVSGVTMNYGIWHQDPPASSYPSCIAVKCASIQSQAAGERMLDSLREAVMLRGENIARESVIMSTAESLTASEEGFDLDRFREAWKNGEGTQAFRQDLQTIRFYKIGRFPTLTFTDQTGWGIVITGYRPYSILSDAVEQMIKHRETRNKETRY